MTQSRIVAITVVTTLVVAALVFGTWVAAGLYDPAAASGGGPVDALLKTMTSRSVDARLRAVPPQPALDSAALAAGAERFQTLCVGCHSAPGVPRDMAGEGLSPQAPDLATLDLSEARIYWVIRNGLRNRGMPAYHLSHTDEQIWAIAKFAKRTAGMSADEYEAVFLQLMDPAAPAAPAHIH